MQADKLMMKFKKVSSLITLIDHQMREIEGLDNKASTSLKAFKKQFEKSMQPLIVEALKPLKPRTANKLLKQIIKDERLSPELLDEIRRSLGE